MYAILYKMESSYDIVLNEIDRQKDDSNYIPMFFLISICNVMAAWFVATFIWLPMKKQGEKDAQNAEKREQTEELPYEERYRVPPTSPDARKETRLYQLVLEQTPKGFVIMRYNKEEEGFEYWSDTIIDYKYLDTVARKYVWTWNCFGVYINRYEMLKKKVKALQAKIEKNKQMVADQSRAVATGDNSNNDTAENGEAEDDETDLFAVFKSKKEKKKLKLKIVKEDIVCDEANKFIRRGKLKDSKIWNTSETEPSKKKQAFKWTDWKFLTQQDGQC